MTYFDLTSYLYTLTHTQCILKLYNLYTNFVQVLKVKSLKINKEMELQPLGC